VKYFITIGFSILLLLLVASQALNSKLENIFKEELNHLAKGELQYSTFSTSFFKNFPEISIKFSHVILLNDTSKIDTLVKLESIQANFSPFSLFEEQIQISKIKFNNPEIFLDYLEKWKIFRRNWNSEKITIKHAQMQFPFSSWIYYRKKKKISYFPNLPTVDLSTLKTSSRIKTTVLVRKSNQPDQSRMEFIALNLKEGTLIFEDSVGVFGREGLKKIMFYEQ
jgi:hypothetical protein